MKFKIKSKVNVDGIIVIDEYVQEFDENENVFGRILIYHKRMQKIFPDCKFDLIQAKRIE